LVSCTIVLHCIKVVKIQIFQNQSFCFVQMFVCLLVCQILSNFRSGASLKGFVFGVFSENFFFVPMGIISVSLSVVFIHLAYSERFISWESMG